MEDEELPYRYSSEEIIEQLRVDSDFADRLWRAFGFARNTERADSASVFSEADLAALAVFAGSDREIDPAAQVAAARSIGQATARLAEWQAEQIRLLAADPRVTLTADQLIDALAHLQQAVWRRHLDSFLARDGGPHTGEGDEVIVGFADIVGYTSLSRRLRLAALEALLESFESAAHLIITTHNGKVIKSIGDAVMFTAPTHAAAADIAIELHALTSDGELPTLRIGLASGRALTRMGDVFGEPVNIAARLASAAREGTTLVDDNLAAALADQPEFYLHHISSLSVRGYRRLKAYVLERHRDAPSVLAAAEREAAEAAARAEAAAAEKARIAAEKVEQKAAKKAARTRSRAERKAAKAAD
ncbi:adenylate/guanylate cyclase domain-containing protein [Gordonia sp. (in: high G+C Gram-positive bacteria)]|uniref:adenylate/guanylate cyclase domain-containing protein n=1 Tax=unclassified Gordonia (in: high G+C Gram-positive bacteria) TaxID=2657482 RepID=UPI00261C878E|nr:adenylate/guanylate cyclase domain-containing protein [Gordonia sp. (in: high G+C Gram-positive bacteria)]